MASSSRAELGPKPGRRGLGLTRKDTPKQACRIRIAQQVTFLSFQHKTIFPHQSVKRAYFLVWRKHSELYPQIPRYAAAVTPRVG